MWTYLAFVFALGCLGCLWPNYVRRGPGYESNCISQNLKQIAGSKEVWATEHHESRSVLLAASELPDFLSQRSREQIFENPRFGEIYRIMPLGVSPEAELTKEVDGRPKGTILRLSPGGYLDVVLPGSPK